MAPFENDGAPIWSRAVVEMEECTIDMMCHKSSVGAACVCPKPLAVNHFPHMRRRGPVLT